MNTILILDDLCTSNAGKKLFSFLGQIFDIIMIIVPILLIVMGSIDFIKAVIAQKDDEIKKSQNMFIKRLIIGVIIFFVPPIVNFVIGLTGISASSPCMECFNNPKSNFCKVSETNNMAIPIETTKLNTSECKNASDKDLCCKEKNGPDDSSGIWIWNDDVGCKNTTPANPD